MIVSKTSIAAQLTGMFAFANFLKELTGLAPSVWVAIVLGAVVLGPRVNPKADCERICKINGFFVSAGVAWLLTPVGVATLLKFVEMNEDVAAIPVAGLLATVGIDAITMMIERFRKGGGGK